MLINNQDNTQENESGMLARKQWVTPVVEIHDVEELTMLTGNGAGDNSGATHS